MVIANEPPYTVMAEGPRIEEIPELATQTELQQSQLLCPPLSQPSTVVCQSLQIVPSQTSTPKTKVHNYLSFISYHFMATIPFVVVSINC